MNRTTLTFALIAALSAGAARAQSNPPVSQPSTPAPNVESTPGPSGPSTTPAPVVVQAPSNPSAASAPATVTQIVYTPQMPSAAEITNAAAAQGLTVERIVQTSTQVIAFYRNANGQAMTVAYQSLPPSGTPVAPATPTVVTTAPPPAVVYETAPRVIYYDYPGYYYPRVWYPPVSLSFGFGYRSFHGGHGGFRHGR